MMQIYLSDYKPSEQNKNNTEMSFDEQYAELLNESEKLILPQMLDHRPSKFEKEKELDLARKRGYIR